MKLLLVIILLVSSSAFGQTCWPAGLMVQTDLMEMFNPKCLKEPQATRCECLKKQQTSNLFVMASFNKDSIPKQIAQRKLDYTERFWDVYRQMNYGAAYQEEILMGEKTPKNTLHTTCTPQSFSKKVQENMKDHFKKKEAVLEKLAEQKQSQVNDCKGPSCEVLKGELTRLEDQSAKSINENYKAACASVIDTNAKAHALKTLNKAKDYFKDIDPKKSLEAEKLILGLEIDMDKAVKEVKAVGELSKDKKGQAAKVTPKNSTFCPTNALKVYEMLQEFESAGAQALNDSQCDKGDDVCESFETNDAAMKTAVANDFQKKPNQCVTKAEFVTFQGKPSAELMRAFNTSADVGSLLKIPSSINNSLDRERVKFLRANPLLVKLLHDEPSRKTLATKLKEMSQKPNPGNMGDYIDFMKKDVSKLLASADAKKDELLLCDQLSKNFTAIYVATDLPPTENEVGANFLETLNTAVTNCQIEGNNKGAITDFAETLKINPLFTLAQDNVDELYDDFIEKNCAKFDAKNCLTEECRMKFLENTNPQMAADLKTSKAKNVASEVTAAMTNNVNNKFDESKQDKKYKKWWEKEVGSKLSKDVIAFKGEESSFADSMRSNEEISSAVSTPAEFSSAPASIAQGSAASTAAPAANPQQVVPAWAKEPVVYPDVVPLTQANLRSAENVTDLIPRYDDLESSDKLARLENVEEKLSRMDGPADESPKVTQLLKEVATLKKTLKETNEAAAPSQAPTAASTPATNLIQPSVVPSFNGAVNQARSVSQAGGNSISQPKMASKASISLNKAILASRDVASSTPGNELKIIVESGLDTKQASRGIVKSLSPTAAQFDQILADPKQLAEYLTKELKGGVIPDSGVIAIINPLTRKEMLYSIFQDSSKNFVVKSVDPKIAVPRTATLQGLKNSF